MVQRIGLLAVSIARYGYSSPNNELYQALKEGGGAKPRKTKISSAKCKIEEVIRLRRIPKF
jgi:hypothetical protein